MHLHQQISAYALHNVATDPKPIKLYGATKFMDNAVKYLTLTKPIKTKNGKYSPASIFETLNREEFIPSDMGDIPSNWLKKLYKLLYEVPRSNYLGTVSKPKMVIYSSAVPYALYAFKSQWGVKYSEWDLEEPLYKDQDFNAGMILLGQGHKNYISKRALYFSKFKKPVPPPNWAPESWLEKYGTEVPFEGDVDQEYNKNWTIPSTDWVTIRKDFLTHNINNLPIDETKWAQGSWSCSPLVASMQDTLYRHMLTQTWVYAPKLRSEHMIHSFEDIDLMPDPYIDITTIKPEEAGTKSFDW